MAQRARTQRVTVDCFHSVLTRAVADPSDVGYLTGRRLRAAGALDVDPEAFARSRREAEVLARGWYGPRCTLSDIARQHADLLRLDPRTAAMLERAEVATEVAVSRPVPSAVRRLDRLRSAGARVTFRADTPLPRAAVADLLRVAGARHDDEPLELPHEPGAAWRTGAPLPPEPSLRLTRYERVLASHRAGSAGLSSLLAGASRRTRLRLAVERPGMPSARVGVAAGVAAPLLVGYVLWCLGEAQRAGCRRAYFVARDGEVLLALARRLAPGLGLDLDLRYLYGNRRAWLLAGMPEIDVDRVAAVLGREERVTVRGSLAWVDLEPEGVAPALGAAGFPPPAWDDHLDDAAQRRLLHVLGDPAVATAVRARGEARAELARDYVRDVGLLDGEPYAVVDLEGHGTIGRLLTALVGRFGGAPPALECYFGLAGEPHPAPGRTPRAYMFDDWRGTGLARRETDVYVALEMFATALHGRVDGYERVDGTVRPVLADGRVAEVRRWGLDDVRHALDVFCEELEPLLSWTDPFADVRSATWQALRAFWLDPTPAEVRAWGDFPFEGDEGSYPVARGFTSGEVLRGLAERRPRLRQRGTWPAGVERSAPAHLRAVHLGADGALAALRRLRAVRADRRGVVTIQ